jgi:UDP-2-acetamido-2,6-beta-L-arabino-hexul-4-ose reductase
VAEIDVGATQEALLSGVHGAAVVFHLAGVNRPEHDDGFSDGNVGSVEALIAAIELVARGGHARPVVVLTSSTQAEQDNPYGRSKLAAERILENYAAQTKTSALIYRLPGVFGKWCRPNYNSAVATFCHNIAHDLAVTISDPVREVELVYIDDVVNEFIGLLSGGQVAEPGTFLAVRPTYRVTLGRLVDLLRSFRAVRDTLVIPDMSDDFTRKLYATYLAALERDSFSYVLDVKTDNRGWLAELLKSPHIGQMFVSKTHAGITRGNHYHHTKVEKFCVLQGEAVIRFRHIEEESVFEYRVSGDRCEVVDIPPGYTHSIENLSDKEMIVLFWASEVFNPEKPDTVFESVNKKI